VSGNAPNNSILHNLLIEKFLKMQREPSAQKRTTEKDNKSDLNIIEEENADSKENSSSKSQKLQILKNHKTEISVIPRVFQVFEFFRNLENWDF
jgi:hypothetical protein